LNGQLHELQRRHHQVRGAVAPGRLQLQHHLASGVALHPFVGQRKAAVMSLTKLKYIVAVACEKHFGRAAEACFVS